MFFAQQYFVVSTVAILFSEIHFLAYREQRLERFNLIWINYSLVVYLQCDVLAASFSSLQSSLTLQSLLEYITTVCVFFKNISNRSLFLK